MVYMKTGIQAHCTIMPYHQDFFYFVVSIVLQLKQLDAGADEDPSHPARLLLITLKVPFYLESL